VNDHQEVLLFLRDDKPGIADPNMCDVLGGHLEKGGLFDFPERKLPFLDSFS
jgi:hypothetical protein